MAVVLWTMALTLLVQRSLFAVGHSDTGCMKWVQRGEQVCCEACFPGNHLVAECGLSPKNLCTPCEPSTYTVQPRVYSCEPCTQCVAAQVLVKQCTATRDTQCGCKEGLLCGDSACSFCVEKCEKGHEPTKDRSCRPCPEGTFNDQIHQKCKPWRTRCPLPYHNIVASGDAFSDIKCANFTPGPLQTKQKAEEGGYLALIVVIGVVLVAFSSIIFVIFVVAMKNLRKRKRQQKPTTDTPIIRPTTDDPRTLIAIECSFHEAQQERGGSSDSVFSKDSSQQLIA